MKTIIELPTVNVIVIDPDSMAIQHLVSFPDNQIGNKEAEKLFRRCVRENYRKYYKDIDSYLEDGYFVKDNYYICIAHST